MSKFTTFRGKHGDPRKSPGFENRFTKTDPKLPYDQIETDPVCKTLKCKFCIHFDGKHCGVDGDYTNPNNECRIPPERFANLSKERI